MLAWEMYIEQLHIAIQKYADLKQIFKLILD